MSSCHRRPDAILKKVRGRQMARDWMRVRDDVIADQSRATTMLLEYSQPRVLANEGGRKIHSLADHGRRQISTKTNQLNARNSVYIFIAHEYTDLTITRCPYYPYPNSGAYNGFELMY